MGPARRPVWLLVALLCWACAGQTVAPVSPAPGPGAASPRPAAGPEVPAPSEPVIRTPGFFWTVESPTASATLLGSIHVGAPDFYPLPARIERAFDAATVLVLEIELTASGQAAVAQATMNRMHYADGDSLDKHLSPDTLDSLRARLEENGVPVEPVMRFRPWALALVLTMVEMKNAGGDVRQGVDLYFARRAQDRKPVISLESADAQIALFADAPDDQQVLALESVLTRRGTIAETMAAITDAWKRGDDAGMERLVFDAMRQPKYRPVYDAMFVRRNIRMADELDRLLRTGGRYFVVVGTGHLVGPDSLVELLRRKGYRVTRN